MIQEGVEAIMQMTIKVLAKGLEKKTTPLMIMGDKDDNGGDSSQSVGTQDPDGNVH
jgi:hypothetical protein